MLRRSVLAGLSGLVAGLVSPGAHSKELTSDELTLYDLELGGDRAFGRALLCAPRELPENPALLVLLHGLGETHDQKVGARAFAERYGLLSAVARLAHPPLERTLTRQDYFGQRRLAELNSDLASRPFPKLVYLCPYMPDPYKAGGDPMLSRYADFLTGRLMATVEQRLGKVFPSERCLISGVSLGGYVALEVFLRKPEHFCGVGSAQGAIGPGQAARYASRIKAVIERVGPRSVELLSSSFDPYRPPNELLQKKLSAQGVASSLRISPGPHDQSWLRESGVIEMLVGAQRSFESAAREQAGSKLRARSVK